MATYKGNSNRIVLITNDEIFALIDLTAEVLDVTVQHVFEVWLEMIYAGDIVTIDKLIQLATPNEIVE